MRAIVRSSRASSLRREPPALRGSLWKPQRPHKPRARRLDWVLLVALATLVSPVAGCTTAADVQAAREEALAERQAEADALFDALRETARTRSLPIARDDAARRRLTTEYLEEGPSLRRRYFLSVAITPSGMAVRVNLVREARAEDATTPEGEAAGETWDELPRTDEVEAEEIGIAREAYERWEQGR